MKCSTKFSFRKRRHHCRTCGLIFCSTCCNQKLILPYKLSKTNIIPVNDINNLADQDAENNGSNQNEMSRVCLVCFDTINKGKKINIFFILV